MRELAVLTFLTLDGVMQAPAKPDEDVSGGFSGGGWAAPYWGPVMDQVNETAMAAPFDLLFGRKTYESFAAHWPTITDDPHAIKLNNAKKYVVTSTLSKLVWSNSIPINGDITDKVAQLKQQDGPLLQVHGSYQLVQTLHSHNLVDEFRLWTFPVVVGKGKRLFPEGAAAANLTLVNSGSTSNGVVSSVYRLSTELALSGSALGR